MTAGLPTERSFGLSVGGACLAAAAVFRWRGLQIPTAVFLTVGALLVILALVAPSLLRPANRVWWRFAQTLGWVNARVVLTVFFALVLTPVGLTMRLFGRNPLLGSSGQTNWRPYPERRRDSRHYEHLF